MKKVDYLPEGVECPVLLTIDCDAEVGMASIRPREERFWMSQGEYEPRAGIWRLLSTLRKHEVIATFCVVGKVAEAYPFIITTIHGDGHEIANHGYTHTPYIKLTEEQERFEIMKTGELLERITGEKVVGHRTPLWNPSTRTIRILEELGYLWNSDSLNDDVPYFNEVDGRTSSIVELPPSHSLNDWGQLIQFRITPRDMLDVWTTEFDILYSEGKMFNLTLHPFEIGRPARTAVLDKLLAHIKAKRGAKFMRAKELAILFAEHAKKKHLKETADSNAL